MQTNTTVQIFKAYLEKDFTLQIDRQKPTSIGKFSRGDHQIELF